MVQVSSTPLSNALRLDGNLHIDMAFPRCYRLLSALCITDRRCEFGAGYPVASA
jgi:hypothetical protein